MSKTRRQDRTRQVAREQEMEARFEAEMSQKAAKPASIQPRLTEREEFGSFNWDDFFTAIISWAEEADNLSQWPSRLRARFSSVRTLTLWTCARRA